MPQSNNLREQQEEPKDMDKRGLLESMTDINRD
jgi:hypothetical protein